MTEDTALCPLCGRSNGCRLCTAEACKGPCWCRDVAIPGELIARVSEVQRNCACIRRRCVNDYHRKQAFPGSAGKAGPGDFYFEGGLLVFTAAYLARRGCCCGRGCRHCPYGESDEPPAGQASSAVSLPCASWP